MALDFFHRSQARTPRRVALLPGAWNPPTTAHVAIARAALGWADEVIFVMPKAFPHKQYEDWPMEQRMALVRDLVSAENGFSAAITESGYYFEIAEEARVTLAGDTEIGLVCGRDAAERIAAWDYGQPGVFEEMIARYPLLVAARGGQYRSPLTPGIIALELAPHFEHVSSTEVRRRAAAGEEWRALVPESIHAEVARMYGVCA